jgi:3-oxoacyl-[acyl-carrier protein] reductase
MSNLSGKTALVTGASRGIGRATALALAKAGAQVIVHYSSSGKEAEAVVAEIRKAGGRAEKVAADLRAPNGPHVLAKLVHGMVGSRLDILVANAGISKSASIEDTTVEDLDELFAVNVRAPYIVLQQLLPAMGQGSSVVFLSSLAARASVGTLSAYGATKGAIATLVTHSRLGTRRARYPRQRRRTRHRRNGYVQLCQDRRRPEHRTGHASPEARRPAGRHRRSRRLPRLRRSPLDHRRHGPGRRRLETLKPHLGPASR